MRAVQNSKSWGMITIKAIGIGVAVSAIFLLGLSIMLAKLVDKELIEVMQLGYGIFGILFLSAFAGCSSVMKQSGGRKALRSMLFCLAYYLLLIAIGILAFGGGYGSRGAVGGALAAGTACAFLLFRKEKKR